MYALSNSHLELYKYKPEHSDLSVMPILPFVVSGTLLAVVPHVVHSSLPSLDLYVFSGHRSHVEPLADFCWPAGQEPEQRNYSDARNSDTNKGTYQRRGMVDIYVPVTVRR